MICLACGYRENEEGEHRCRRCGRRLERGPAAARRAGCAAPAAAPDWKQDVSRRLEDFQRRRGLQPSLFGDQPEDEVPRPSPGDKVIAFDDVAPERIEPLIVAPPRATGDTSRRRLPPLPDARRSVAGPAAPRTYPRGRESAQAVTPVSVRALAGALDLAVALVAVGVFFGVFHLLGGAAPLNQRAAAWLGAAVASLVAFYFFAYVFYGSETPGLQWMGLCVMDYEGRPPQAGQRLVRAVGVLLSAAALGLGYLWALADEEGLTWHDRMSKTFVGCDPNARKRG